jgi:hypothetical protein
MPYVDSGMISWLDYDADSRTLAVRFHAAPVLYSYEDVPPETYEAFLAAPSKNSFFRDRIDPRFRLAAQPLERAGDIGPVSAAAES